MAMKRRREVFAIHKKMVTMNPAALDKKKLAAATFRS